MTRKIEYHCNLCRDLMGNGYGINWVGNKLKLVNDAYNAKQLEHHICINCVNQIEAELEGEKMNVNVAFS